MTLTEPRVLVDVPPQIEVLWRLLFQQQQQHHSSGVVESGCVESAFVDVVAALIVDAAADPKPALEHGHTGRASARSGGGDDATPHSSSSMPPPPPPSSATQIGVRELIRATIEEVFFVCTSICMSFQYT